MTQQTLFDAAASREARDAGLALVGYNAADFIPLGLMMIGRLAPWTYTGEDIRRQLTAAGITPHHANAWGALVRCAIKRGLLHPTGRYLPMVAVSSHARKTAEYEKRII